MDLEQKENAPKRKGRRKKYLDLSTLVDADQVREPEPPSFVVTCSICGSSRNVGCFKNKHICTRCIKYIKERN